MSGVEIEIKAAVQDRQALEANLHDQGVFVRRFTKEDRYYGLSEEAPETRFRLRYDAPDWTCTYKTKSIHRGIEESRELEFDVSDGESFDRFARALGFVPLYVKRKTGERWDVAEVTVEISEVNDLGTYIEVELLLDENAPAEERTQARERVRRLLDRLGLPESAIEPRTYTRMIHEKLSGVTDPPGHSL